MISHERKFIFVHTPKTAGTSVEECLKDYGIMQQGPRNFNSIYFKHITARELKRMLGDQYDNYFKFSVIRNPWDWLISTYEFNRGISYPFMRGTPFTMPGRVPPELVKMPFTQWIVWFSEGFKMQQYDVVSDNKGNCLVDYIIQFEELQTGLEHVLNHLGLPLPKDIPRLKASNRKSIGSYYKCLADVELVEKYFPLDVRLFNYCAEDIMARIENTT